MLLIFHSQLIHDERAVLRRIVVSPLRNVAGDADDRRSISTVLESSQGMFLTDDAAHGRGHIDPEFRLPTLQAQPFGSLKVLESLRELLRKRISHAAREHEGGIVAGRVERAGEGLRGIPPLPLHQSMET